MTSEEFLRLLAIIRKEIVDYTAKHRETIVQQVTDRLGPLLSSRMTEDQARALVKATAATPAQVEQVIKARLAAHPVPLGPSAIEELIQDSLGSMARQLLGSEIDQLIRSHVDALPPILSRAEVAELVHAGLPTIDVKVVQISHLEHARAKITWEDGHWLLTLWIPVFRGADRGQWAGSGFVAQATSGGPIVGQQFYVQPTLPAGNSLGVPLLLLQTGQFSDPDILQPWVYY